MNSRTKSRILAIGWTLLLLIGASIPGSTLDGLEILTFDKVIHTVGFAVFAILWLRVFPDAIMKLLVSGVLYGLFIEVYQHIVPINRTFDVYDAIADCMGLGIGIGLFFLWSSRSPEKHKQEGATFGT